MKRTLLPAWLLSAILIISALGLSSCSPRVYGGVEDCYELGPGRMYYNYDIGGGRPHYSKKHYKSKKKYMKEREKYHKKKYKAYKKWRKHHDDDDD